MSVQLLNSEYIKRNQQQVQQWINEGLVKKQGNQYFVVGENNIAAFSESCFVKDGDSVKQYQINRKGTVVERTAPQHTGKVIGTPTKTYSVPVSQIIERMGITDENLKTEFNQFLAQQKELKIDQEGNISFDNANKTALNNALKTFAELHKENFVDPNAQKYIEFSPDSAQEAINYLQEGDNPAIQQDAQGRYAVKNQNALNKALTEQIGETTYEQSDSRSAKLNAGVSTHTVTEENMVDIPEKLRESRASRKTLQKDAGDAYAELVASANEDPQLRDAIDLYIAESKYSKKIDKRMEKLMEYKTTMGGDKNKKVKRDAGDIIQLYINKYADKEDKDKLNDLVKKVQNSNSEKDQKAILEALKGTDIIGIPDSFDKLDESLKKKGALLAVAKECGYDSKTLLRLMATYDVMNDRTSAEIIADDKYFIKHQAKDFVKNQQAEQDIKNTTVHFSKKGKKSADGDGKIHNDIGDKGRALVKACPEMLGDVVTDNTAISQLSSLNDKQLEEKGYIKAKINGQVKYFQFSESKWKTFMGICCDPSNATEEQVNVLFGNDEKAKKAFMKDLNLTLQEGRSVLEMNLPSPYGETGSLRFENIVGNNNGKIGNRELNALRGMVESAGYSVDKNKTAGKRAVHIIKGAGIGLGLGLLTGGMGSLLAGAVNIAGTVAGAVNFKRSGVINDVDIYNQQEYKNGVLIDDRTITVNEEHKWSTEGTENYSKDYKDKGNKHLESGLNAGILAAIGGAVTNAATAGGVHAKGRNTDILFNLKREVPHDDYSDEQLDIELPQYTSVETRKGEIPIGVDIPKLKAVRYRGPEAYNGLYKYEDGSPVSPRDFTKAYQNKIGGVMTDYNFFVYPELEVPGKGKIVPVENYEEEYRKITPGTSGGQRGVVINPQGKKIYTAKGTIK